MIIKSYLSIPSSKIVPSTKEAREKSVNIFLNMARPALSPGALKNSSPIHTKTEVRIICIQR